MKILTIGDTHFPFLSVEWFAWILQLSDQFQPDRIIHVGDLIDQYAFSRWPKHPDSANVSEEVRLTRENINLMEAAFPKMDLIMGNHDDRLKKRLFDIGIPQALVHDYREIYGIPEGWNIHPDSLELDGVFYYHGHMKGGNTPALSMALQIGQPVVCGHHHSIGGKYERNINGHSVWGMDTSCGVDISSYGMYYAKEMLRKPVLGAGTITDGMYAKHYRMGELNGCYE